MKIKIEHSKLLTLLAYIPAVLFSGLAVYVALTGGDAGAIANIALAYIALLGTTLTGYLWKAEAENKVKITLGMMKEVKKITGEHTDVETINNVLKE